MNTINFKMWAFHFAIWIVIINIIIAYLLSMVVVTFFEEVSNVDIVIFRLGMVATILLVLTVIFVVLSIIKKEKRNYQFWISVVGLVVFGGLSFLA